jgi:hypothetical protein
LSFFIFLPLFFVPVPFLMVPIILHPSPSFPSYLARHFSSFFVGHNYFSWSFNFPLNPFKNPP